jgi:hypothetical protein
MLALRLGDVPDDLFQRVEELALRHQRSVLEEALHLLADAVARAEQAERAKLKEMLEELDRTRIVPRPGTPDSVEMLREDRAR